MTNWKVEGYHPEIEPLTFGQARIIWTDGHTNVSAAWYYRTRLEAINALSEWVKTGYEGEPGGVIWRRIGVGPKEESNV